MCVCSLCYLLLAVTLLLITPITNSHTHRTGSSFSRAGFVYILYTIVRVILKKKLDDDTLLSSSLHEAKRGWRFAITWRRTGDDLPVATGAEAGGGWQQPVCGIDIIVVWLHYQQQGLMRPARGFSAEPPASYLGWRT